MHLFKTKIMSKLLEKYKKLREIYENQIVVTDEYRSQIVGLKKELEKCRCKNAKFTRTMNVNCEPICGGCGKET